MTLKDWHHVINDYLLSYKSRKEVLNEDEWEERIHYAAEPYVEADSDI